MGDYYRKSEWGLNMDTKKDELTHRNARFLLLVNNKINSHTVAGFCHYRFDYDDEDDPSEVVVYVYELQINDTYKRQGLGKHLMNIVEAMAKQNDIPKVMLTVFRANQAALDFYQHGLSYTIDDNSPSKHTTNNVVVDYEILSKQVL